MSIASEIIRIQTDINNIYDVLEDRGTILPSVKNSANLSVAINDYNVALRTPLNCRQLVLWLDGDCNTRGGLDRSKKYMENLVWNRPFENQGGNFEYVSTNSSNNVWNDKFLLYKGTYTGLINNIFYNSTWTLELVYKVFSSPTWTENSFNPYQGLTTNTGAALTILPDGRTVMFYYPQSGGSLVSVGMPTSMTSTETCYYACYIGNGNTIRLKIISPNYDTTVTNYARMTLATNIGMFNSGGNSFTPNTPFSTNDKSAGLGMLRGWSRVLSDAEITANYEDAKRRFNCV